MLNVSSIRTNSYSLKHLRILIPLLLLLLGLSAEAQLPTRPVTIDRNLGSRPNGSISNRNNPNNRNSDNPWDTTASDASQPKGIDYDHIEESDSALLNAVFVFSPSFHTTKILSFRNPSLSPDGIAFADKTSSIFSPYHALTGSMGHPHLSLWHQSYQGCDRAYSSWFAPDVNLGYSHSLHNLSLYQTYRPFTSLAYHSSLNKDYQLQATHTQNITSRWNFSIDFDLIKREGQLTRSGTSNSYFDVTTNYYSVDSRYQLQAAFMRRNIYVEENGGVASDAQFQNSGNANLAGIPVNLYKASSQWKSSDLFLHQTYNTVRQFEKIIPRTVKVSYDSIVEHKKVTDSNTVTITDTLHLSLDSIVGYDTLLVRKPSSFNTGVFGLDLRYSHTKRNYTDEAPSSDYYPTFYIDSTLTFDSLYTQHLSADLYWTNDAYMDHRWINPLKVTLGLMPQIFQVRYPDNTYNWSSLSPNASALLRLGSSTLGAQAHYTLSNNHLNGEHLLKVYSLIPIKQYILNLSATSTASAPQWIYYQYYSNSYQWNHSQWDKIQTQQISLDLSSSKPADTLRNSFFGNLHISASQVCNNIWFDETLTPTQTSDKALLLQAQLQGSLTLGWFHYDMQHSLQHTDRQDILPLPLFATKNSLYGDFKVFHDALQFQTGFDIRYHTRYHAPGYNPALGMFYHQDQVQVGNYPWIDLFVTLRIKQACVYLRATHINYFLNKERINFLLPHYPSEDLGLYFGVVWKFFN